MATSNTSQFGDFVDGLQKLGSLFGGQTREQSQQFSTDQVGDQAIAANSAATQSGLSSLGLQKEASAFAQALAQQGQQYKTALDYQQANQMRNLNADNFNASIDQARYAQKVDTATTRYQSDNALRAAKAQSQGQVLSSLFGGLSSGSQNYRYWN